MTDTQHEAPETTDRSKAGHLDFPVVGLGASAGGIEALQQFFDHMPPANGMAFVIVLHLSPHHESNAAAILQRHTGMPVLQVTEPVQIAADHVYVIPPSADLVMDDGWLRLAEPARVRGPLVAIDLFFRTLAAVHQSRAVCAVLSGTGSDGAIGLKRVKELGGVTLAQVPDDANFSEMPRSAIATGMVDFVLSAAEMPQRLVELWRNAQRIWLPAVSSPNELGAAPVVNAGDPDISEKALYDIMALLGSRTGHDFRHYKRATVLRRIERRLQVCGKPDLPAYALHLRDHADESTALLQDMLISVTNFFRDREAFEALERDVIPSIFEGRTPEDSVRAWVAGCATGEEAYSLSILLREAAEKRIETPTVQIFATDIDERALAVARAGAYPVGILADVSAARAAQFFHKEGEELRVTKQLREPMLFAAHNVLRDPPFSRLDLICCRNLLIYVGREAQTSILEMFRFALRPGGYLFLGSSESAEVVSELFTVIDKKNRIYRVNPNANSVRHRPLMNFTPTERVTASGQAAAVTRDRSRSGIAELHLRAIEHNAAPSILVDEKLAILHLSEGAGRYLEQAGGLPTTDLLPNVRPSLRIELRTALFQLTQGGRRVDTQPVRFEHGGLQSTVRISVCPIQVPDSTRRQILVIFQEVQDSVESPPAPADPQERQLVVRYEREVEQLKEHLRNTVEHADISTEELKASNEELQAINEELRSATEELETSKEELQSMNEELSTVNFELKTKVEETGKVNDDLQNFILASDIATVFIDRGMRIKRFTPQAATVFNVIGSDIDRPLLDITSRLRYPELEDDMRQVFDLLRVIERPVQGVEGRHYLARIRPYRTLDDKIAGAVLTFVDVTELRQAQQAVADGQERLRIAALTTQDYAIVTMDPHGIVNTWNEGARLVFGWNAAEVIGQHMRLLFTPEDRAAGVPESELMLARESGRAEDERWHLRKDGSVFYCSGVMTSLREGDVGGFVKIARDATSHKRIEVAREALLREEQAASSAARSANELKDQFLAVMSHELKHPLNLIQVHAELLMRLPELRGIHSVLRAAESIRGAVRSQAKIIDDLLDLSRVRTGKLTLNREPVLIVEALHSIYEAARSDASEKNITLLFSGPEDETLLLHCDRVRTEQIVWNLVSNAIKFTPANGEVSLALAVEGHDVRIRVTDNGRGISQAYLPQIFGLFSQEADRGAELNRGLGIGLALVQELAVAQGGRVLAESAGLDEGSTFSVWLPLSPDPMVPVAAAAAATNVLRGLRMLVVDDMPDALEPFVALLRGEGALVDACISGSEAIRLLETGAHSLLVSDIGMPVMDGFELVAAVRRSGRADIIAIAMTGYGRPADAERARRAGFDAHIAKPIDFGQFERLVASLLRPGA
jgi:two-component system CheB/CheR fusion protein